MHNDLEADISYYMNYFDNYLFTGDRLISFWLRQGRSIVRGPEREQLNPWMTAFQVDSV